MNKSTLSMILGLVSLLGGIIGLIVGFWSKAGGWLALIALICGIVAIVFSSSAKKQEGTGGNSGLVMGIIGLIFSAIVGVSCLICNCAHYYEVVDIAIDAAQNDADLSELEQQLNELSDLLAD